MPTSNPTVLAALKSLKLRDRVEVEWIDAHNVQTYGWVSLAEITDEEVICRVTSLGYFLCVKQDFVVLAGDSQIPQIGITEEFHSTSAIPIGCVERITVVVHG